MPIHFTTYIHIIKTISIFVKTTSKFVVIEGGSHTLCMYNQKRIRIVTAAICENKY